MPKSSPPAWLSLAMLDTDSRLPTEVSDNCSWINIQDQDTRNVHYNLNNIVLFGIMKAFRQKPADIAVLVRLNYFFHKKGNQQNLSVQNTQKLFHILQGMSVVAWNPHAFWGGGAGRCPKWNPKHIFEKNYIFKLFFQ